MTDQTSSPLPSPGMNRRQLLRNGGLALSLGAVIAACGDDRGGSDNPGRLGVADTAPELPSGAVDDALVLRTAQSIELAVVEVYSIIAPSLGSEAATLAERLVADHEARAAQLGQLATAAGGEPYDCINPFVADRSIAPMAEALDGSDDPERDAHNVAHAFETWLARSYQAMVPMITENIVLRGNIMEIGNEANRHAAAIALVINPDEPVNPVLYGREDDAANLEFAVPYAVTGTFGQLGPFVLVLGAVDDEGARTSISLQTPAENTFVYPEMTCEA